MKKQNVFCLACDVSRNSMLALRNFTEQKYRNKKKMTLVEFSFVYAIWEFSVMCINSSMSPLMTK